ncbi:MAG: UDP-N-acetylglucosamine 2-epimerase (non-hydrolyzing), partial [Elusimicrobiota bacterium]
MRKKRILFVFGTRPEVVKLAPVIKVFRQDRSFDSIVAATGQHRQMLSQMTKSFGIKVDHNLDLMTDNQTLSHLTQSALVGLDRLYGRLGPDLVMLQGDTTTVMAGALAAFYSKIPVAPVEAGLRAFDMANPYPEEFNRIMADRLSALRLAPTPRAKDNLIKEGLAPKTIIVTGNTGLEDAASVLA